MDARRLTDWLVDRTSGSTDRPLGGSSGRFYVSFLDHGDG